MVRRLTESTVIEKGGKYYVTEYLHNTRTISVKTSIQYLETFQNPQNARFEIEVDALRNHGVPESDIEFLLNAPTVNDVQVTVRP